ncbi:MAG: glycoside hydrolase family 127 protein [Bacteroidetes bacterium]|nr:glycoside hydrolase family 127 protein [Bacteroidota bacterium]
MKTTLLLLAIIMSVIVQSQNNKPATLRNNFYITNQAPLVATPYTQLPIGAIKPQGWLLNMLNIQKDGLTGHLDEIYPEVCGNRNAWLGGDGDSWERGPYWVDGLVALAYVLNDDNLKAKAAKWIEWMINSQQPSGYFGPKPFTQKPVKENGVQKIVPEDWWPRMVMLKALQQYYMATNDQRVIQLMTHYFKYQLQELPKNPLNKYSWWSEQRGGENLAVIYWLYNITKDKFLLTLSEIVFKQTYDWTTTYGDGRLRKLNPYPDFHCVNLAQALKQPIIYYQQHPEAKYINAVKEGLSALHDSHGFINGMYGADENLHGNDPTQGSELCSAVEMMFSFENILPITGDAYFADYLEKIAFNVLPTQANDDFTRRQYFQQVNQVLCTYDDRNFYNDGDGRIVFGLITGYPCCTVNMHQGWPKLAQNLWYASADNGLAALIYSASEVTAKVTDGTIVRLKEETDYPFSDKIQFTYLTEKSVTFPLHLRIPAWCDSAKIMINEKEYCSAKGGQIIKIDRQWNTNDKVWLQLPMKLQTSRWFEGSVGIERGPLVYALKIGEDWREVKTKKWKDSYFEVYPTTPWNIGLSEKLIENNEFEFVKNNTSLSNMPWNLENAPVMLKTKGIRLPGWTLNNFSAGKIPIPTLEASSWANRNQEEPIILIPYGCTTLRIAEFPVVPVK